MEGCERQAARRWGPAWDRGQNIRVNILQVWPRVGQGARRAGRSEARHLHVFPLRTLLPHLLWFLFALVALFRHHSR